MAINADGAQSVVRVTGKCTFWHSVAALLVVLIVTLTIPAAADTRQAVVLTIDGAIGPAVAGYVSGELAAVPPADTGLVILRIDTPGGLDSSMREIIRAILASPVPVAAYVAPGGARAASAGTYITYAIVTQSLRGAGVQEQATRQTV